MLKNLERFAREEMILYPHLRSSIWDCVEIAREEIEEGGSEAHECELAEQSIKDIIKEAIEDFEDFEN